ncbi:WD40 repeat domain-containing protein [Catellatospora coxensis]|uniref:WD40 repeat domain-containing protein n=3 Tax=Catellatospora coxensis TaxID=310354 RepID=UPI0031CDFC64
MPGHTDRVWSTAWTLIDDGSTLLATSGDSTVRIYNATTGQHLHTYDDQTGVVYSVALTNLPDGTALLATGSSDGTAHIYNATTGQHLHTHHDHIDNVWSVAFTNLPDGTTLLATGSSDHTARVYNATTGQHLHTSNDHTQSVYYVAFTNLPDGTTLLATASGDNTVRIYDVTTGEHLHTYHDHTGAVWSVAFTNLPDGTTLLATTSSDGTARIYNATTGQHLHTYHDHTDNVWSVAFANLPNGTTLLATAGGDHTVRIIGIDDNRFDRVIEHSTPVNTVSFSWLGSTLMLATGSDDAYARIWTLGIPPAPSAQIAVSSEDFTVTLEPTSFIGHTQLVYSTALTALPDGTTLLATASFDHTVRVHNATTGLHLHTHNDHTGPVYSVAFANLPDSTTLLATGSNDRTVRIYDATTGQHLHTHDDHTGSVYSVAFANLPDGTTLLATSSGDHTVRVYDATTGQHLHTHNDHTDNVWSVAFANLPDGTTLLATSSGDHTVRVYNATTGQHLHTHNDHTSSVYSVAYTNLPDGTTLLATGSNDHTVRIYDATTGQHLRTYNDHNSPVLSVAFANLPDGTALLATGNKYAGVQLREEPHGQGLCLIDGQWGTPRAASELALHTLPDGSVLVAVTFEEEHAPTIRRISLTGRSEVALSPQGSGMFTGISGIAALSSMALHPPLQLLDDLLDLLITDSDRSHRLALLTDHPRVRQLRALAWPRAARVGMAALLVADVAFDIRLAPPPSTPAVLVSALSSALVSPGRASMQVATPSIEELLTGADNVTESVVTLLTVLGPSAVAADPTLPVRLRHLADGMPPVDTTRLRQLQLTTNRLVGRRTEKGTSSQARSIGGEGVTSRGRITSLLPTQLALPADVFQLRHAQSDLLYRDFHDLTSPLLEEMVIVLDTSPATFGPVEGVLRSAAHVIAKVFQATGQAVWLITLDDPERCVPLGDVKSMATIWSARGLSAPDVQRALRTAHSAGAAVTLLLSEPHLVWRFTVRADRRTRVLTSSPPGFAPVRGASGPWWMHVPSQAGTATLARAVARMLAPDDRP